MRITKALDIAWTAMGVAALVLSAGLIHRTIAQSSLRPGQKSIIESPDSLTKIPPLLGSPKAATKIVMFGDYECPPCRREWPKIEDYFEKHSSTTAVYFHHFPLSFHKHALAAAVVSEVSRQKDEGLTWHRRLLQTKLDDASMRRMQTELRLSSGSGRAVLEAKRQVADDVALGNRLGVAATPTLYVIRGSTVSMISDVGEL